MPKFKYTARDSLGKALSGSLEARDHSDLRHMLRVNDLYLTRFRQTSRPDHHEAGAQAGFLRTRTKTRDVVILVRQLAALTRAGVPLATSLGALYLQVDKPDLKGALKSLQQGVVEGRSLSSTMLGYPKIFNSLTVALVQAGEGTGTLDKSLEVAAEQLDREEDLRSRVKAAMMYPKIVVAAAIGTVALMLVLVVPTFAAVYKEFNGTLPGTTLALMAISDFTVHFWWVILGVALVVWLALRKFRATPGGKRFFDTNSLKIPIVGVVLRKVAIARFTQTLATAFRGGVPVLESLQLAAMTSGNTVIRDAALETIKGVREGEAIAPQLERSGEFPPMVIQMVHSGESSGSLDDMLDEINRYYDEDIKYAVEQMTKLVEPVMTFVVGGIVLFVLLALYMPIFNLGKTILGQH